MTGPGSDGVLVIVSGLPAAGKSTLAARVGREFRCPVLHRDRMRRAVFRPFEDQPDAGPLIAAATDQLILEVVGMVTSAGGTIVLDGNFNTERHMTPVREFVASSGVEAVEICLWGEPDVLRRRFIERADPPLGPELEPYFESVLHRPRTTVLPHPFVLAHLDTTDITTIEQGWSALRACLSATLDRSASPSEHDDGRPGR